MKPVNESYTKIAEKIFDGGHKRICMGIHTLLITKISDDIFRESHNQIHPVNQGTRTALRNQYEKNTI
jgi:hypothetical protein